MKKQKLVSIIIVNWNGIRWLSDCFGSLYKQDWKNFEIIFVDNASKDESVKWVKHNFPKTKIIVNNKNLGFSDANNIGYKASKGKYILFLNNDTRVTKTFISELVKVLDSDLEIGGAQSKILLMDHPDIHDSVGAFLTPTGFLYHYGFGSMDGPEYDKQIDLYTAKGACMMFKKDILKKVEVEGDILDPSYFAYFEETDMCHRVWLAGYRVVYAYKSVIYHKMGATSSTMNNAFVQYHSFKNRINSYLKNFEIKQVFSILIFHILLTILISYYSLIIKRKYKLFLAIQKALWWNIYNIRRSLYQRTIINGMRHDYHYLNKYHLIKYPKLSYFLNLTKNNI